ncbi:MAG: hypothetical protein BWX66_00370 [Deltaproteobacteria bacterium ADurb.Bin058]|jgi:cysteinyl-tRNA synthetase|nr:MAG: hypothetical protein BWX66_00370 [Deltaproteobacteria bacterium ADurb.Bin058]
MVLVLLTACVGVGCVKGEGGSEGVEDIDFRQEMRQFVIEISQYAKQHHAGFVVIPQNGAELVTLDGESDGALADDYLTAIDAHGQESLFYGYDADDLPTPAAESDYMKAYLDRAKAAGKVILVTDYCFTTSKVADSYTKNAENGFVSFAANSRGLDSIPPTPAMHENAASIANLADIKNFLYLINPADYPTKDEFIAAVCATNYDAVIMDAFFEDGTVLFADDTEQLRKKANGGRRLVIAYMSIGEAEDYRFYWQPSWNEHKPDWLDKENPSWEGNYKVRYWKASWKSIIYGNENAYLDRILASNFDGVYLDIIDAFEYFE